ncbi:MAG: hypothetical protein LBE02_09205 [Spirochaetaceae bacterium]|jgi:hypothetical protein|nr:hypothetical protein [Spirochaetaceae bacterium]
MNRLRITLTAGILVLLAGFLYFVFPGFRNNDSGPVTVLPEYDPMSVLPAVVDDETDAKIYEVPTPEPLVRGKETLYPLYYGGEVALTKSRAEWESWLRDPSLAPLPALHNDRDFVLAWRRQFAQYEPEDVGLILMNYFEYDLTYTRPSNPWGYTHDPRVVFFYWAGLRKCIEDRKIVCAGYAQLFYLIVKEKYPDVTYIVSDEINHARNYFEGDHWDLTWLDDRWVDYNPDKIKFDFVGMQKRIAGGIDGNVGSDWRVVKLVEGNGGSW